MKSNTSENYCSDSCCRIIQASARREKNDRIAAEKFQELVRSAENLRNTRASELAVEDPESFPVAIVPHTSAPVDEPDPVFVQNFERHLQKIVHQALTGPEQESDWPRRSEELLAPALPRELPVIIQACTACRGDCCIPGGDHAFLSVGIIRRFMAQHPGLDAEEIVDHYLSRLPQQSLRGSCVFHAENGCNLPREMRSDVCNQHLCNSLVQVRNQMTDCANRFFVVSESDGKFHGNGFVETSPDEDVS